MKDTFHLGDTMHVHIEFPRLYRENNTVNRLSVENLFFSHVVGFIKDTTYLIETALKNSKVIVDTSRFNVFKRQFNVSGDYSILGYIKRTQEKYIVDYAYTLNDTGWVNSRFFYFELPDYIEFDNGCRTDLPVFNLVIPPGEDDNYDLWKSENNPMYIKYKYDEDNYQTRYKSRASYTFYVVE